MCAPPRFLDSKTPKDAPRVIEGLDAMAYGMGCCCLQVTFQARDATEARYCYDQLAALAPVMLALTAAAQTPRVCLAALAYVAALYLDCRGAQPALAPAPFAATVLAAFCRVLPVYPFLAIAISFGFLFVVSAFERLGWATDVLNLPIYYGTLYGPFSWIYWTVKRRVVRGSQELPTDRNAVLY